MDLSGVEDEANIFEILETTARDVKDRETLKAFVEGMRVLIPILEENGPAYLATIQAAIRTAGEDFKYDSIYLIVLDTDGLVIFHGANPSFDGQNMIDLEDANGVKKEETTMNRRARDHEGYREVRAEGVVRRECISISFTV